MVLTQKISNSVCWFWVKKVAYKKRCNERSFLHIRVARTHFAPQLCDAHPIVRSAKQQLQETASGWLVGQGGQTKS